MEMFSSFLKTKIFFLLVFLSLLGISKEMQAQSWVSQASQGGFIIKKVVSDTTVATGQPFSYTIYYTIPAGAVNVTIKDVLPPNLIFLGASYTNVCGIPTVVAPAINALGGTYSLNWTGIPGGCTGSITINVAFPNGTTCNGTGARNDVCITGSLTGKLYDFCTGYVNTTAIAVNPWHVNKYPLGVAWQGGNCPYASASDTITYQICVFKDVGTTGQYNLTGGVVRDTLPTGAVLVSSTCGATQTGNVVSWNVGNMSANQMYNTACCQFVVYYPPTQFPAGTSLTNQCTLTGLLGSAALQPCGSVNTQSAQTCVQLVSITKGTLYKWVYTNRQPGCAGQYLIYICNNGTTPLIFTALDTLPAQLTNYSLGSTWNLNATLTGNIVKIVDTLAPGVCGYVYVNFTIPLNAVIGSTITNCAYLSYVGQAPASVCVSFVVAAPSPQPCLWKEVCSQQTSYTPGSTFRYRLRIQNIGGQPMTGTTLTDNLDPNLIYVGNPSYYISNTWNTPCTTTPSNPWSGVNLTYNSITNVITATLDTIPAVCQSIFYGNCGMYGTAGVPFYFIEFDVKVRDSAALGNVPNLFTLTGGSLGTGSYPSNTVYVLITGEIGFSLDKGVKKPTDPNYGTTTTINPGDSIDYRLKMNSSGTAALRYVTFADLLPRDAYPNDSKILQLCNPRGSQFDVALGSYITSTPAITKWYNPYNAGLATVNNFLPTGAPGNAFSIGCAGSGGSWFGGWATGNMNIGAHFGPTAIGVGGASVEFSGLTQNLTPPISGTACNTFAASGWTKHLIQSNIVTFQLAGQSESNPVCITIDTTHKPTGCLDSIRPAIKCIGMNAAGLYDYAIQIGASSCAPATFLINSPDGSFVPASFSLVSSPWTINTVFTHTNGNNPITIHYALLCNGVVCKDSLKLDLPDCTHQPPDDCCAKFIHKVFRPQISWTVSGSVNLSTGLVAGTAFIKRFTATIVSAQLRRFTGTWQRIFGDIVGGNLVVAPAPGPQLLSLFSRTALWGPGQCIDWNNGANLNLNMIFPPVSGLFGYDSLKFAIAYTFTDCNCLTCDTVVYYTIVRKWRIIPWDDSNIHILRGNASGKSDVPQGSAPPSTGIVMDDKNNGNLWVISPNDSTNDITITGIEFTSQAVPLTGLKNGAADGVIQGNVGFVQTNVQKGASVPISLVFNNSQNVMQFAISVRYAYTAPGFTDPLYSDPIIYTARVPGAASDKVDIDKATQPQNVNSFALYINNANGYNQGIYAVGIKPQGTMKILAVGPPSSDNGTTYLVPQLQQDGSYIITVPATGMAGLDPSKEAKPIFITLSGYNPASSALDFTTYDNNMQEISQGTLMLTNPLTSVSDGGNGGGNAGAYLNPVSPNPAKNYITISFTLNNIETNAKLSIIDMQGRNVMNVLQNTTLEQGSHLCGVDVSNLPSGVYIIELQTQSGIITKSLSIVK